MKLKIIGTAHHRNGVAGAPFDVALFKVHREPSVKVGILFDDLGFCAILDVTMLAAGDIAFGSYQWRGDDYEPELRRATACQRDTANDTGLEGTSTIPHRVEKCAAILRHYSGDVFSSLTDVLADAMHWCDASGEDFHYALSLAGKHYVAELNDQQTNERKLP